MEGNFVGEGNVLGGVLVVDKTGSVLYQYEETTGDQIPKDEIISALGALVDA